MTLSDRVLVMSRRPGRIIDEIKVDLPHRENPIARRHDARVHEYVARLMDRLDIDPAAAEGAAGITAASGGVVKVQCAGRRRDKRHGELTR